MAVKLVQRSPDPAILTMAETVARGRKIDDPIAREVAEASREVSIGADVDDVSAEFELPVEMAEAKAHWDKRENRMVVPSEKERFLRGVASRLSHVRKYLGTVNPTVEILRTEALWDPVGRKGIAFFRFVRKAKYERAAPTE